MAVAREQEAASAEPGGRKRATANAKNTKWDLPRVIHRFCRSGKAKDEPEGVRNSLGTAIVWSKSDSTNIGLLESFFSAGVYMKTCAVSFLSHQTFLSPPRGAKRSLSLSTDRPRTSDFLHKIG